MRRTFEAKHREWPEFRPQTFHDGGEMTDETHDDKCDSLKKEGEALAEIAKILKFCDGTPAARRVLVAAGLVSGVFDIADDYRIFYVREKKQAERIKVL